MHLKSELVQECFFENVSAFFSCLRVARFDQHAVRHHHRMLPFEGVQRPDREDAR